MLTLETNSEVIEPPVHCELGLVMLSAYLIDIVSIGMPNLYAHTAATFVCIPWPTSTPLRKIILLI